ncbi:MAG: hypothetical protein ACTSYA_12085 [Candidatus Kariarchaeaceae archaeon]
MGLFSKDKKIKSKITSLTDFQYSGKPRIEEDLEQVVAISASSSTTQFTVSALKEKVPRFPIICVGGAACRIGESIKSINTNEKLISLFLIDTDEKLNQTEIRNKLVLNSGKPLSNHFTRGQRVIKAESAIVQSFLENGGISKSDHSEIVFVIVSAGGTGSGVGLGVIDHLISIGKRPVPIMLLPFKEESSRLLFNSATLLYHCTYGPKSVSRNLLSIIIDQQLFANLNTKVPYSELLGLVNDRIASVLLDVLLFPHLEGSIYPIDYSEFVSLFSNLKGASSLIMLDVPSDFDFLDDYKLALPLSNSIIEKPSKVVRGMLGLQTAQGSITIENYRNMLNYFNNKDILTVLNENPTNEITMIRGLMLGYEMPDRVVEIFDYAKNIRLKVLNSEEKLRNENAYVPNIEGIDENNDYEPSSLND